MKKLIYLLMAVSLVFTACKKEEDLFGSMDIGDGQDILTFGLMVSGKEKDMASIGMMDIGKKHHMDSIG